MSGFTGYTTILQLGYAMTANKEKIRKAKHFFKPKTQPSLFHYIKETSETTIWRDTDWSFLYHPIRTFKQEWRLPRTKPSLFHYVEKETRSHFDWKEFVNDLFTGFRNPLFIPSVFSNPETLVLDRARGRSRKMEAGMVSILVHAGVLSLIFLAVHQAEKLLPKKDIMLFVSNPIFLPFEGGDGQAGGGGGGGGKNQEEPPATGRLPQTTRVQTMPPDPGDPKPLLSIDDPFAQVPSVQLPIEIAQDNSLPIGDITAPPNGSVFSGPGSGGGIGTGRGPGIGSGNGPGVGSGSNGGIGDGPDGGMGHELGHGIYMPGNGVKPPIPLAQPLPNYTEEARKARTEGTVFIQLLILKDGSIGNIRVLRGLGHGLDESAIHTIATKWRFRPGTLNGMPVDVQANVEVVFRLY